MNSANVENARDAALHIYRVFQNILKSASDKQDISTVKTVLREFDSLFREFYRRPGTRNVQALTARLQQVQDTDEREALSARMAKQQVQNEAKQRLREGKLQVIFGLAAWTLDKFVADPRSKVRGEIFDAVVEYLPKSLPQLTSVFDSLNDRDPAEYWGWDWWDLPADGEAHYLDTHTKPNRLFCVCALRLLADLPPPTIAQMNLPHSHALAFLADPTNNQGLIKLLLTIQQSADAWQFLLNPDALAKIPDLMALLEKSRQAERIAEEDRLIAATISEAKVTEFNKNLLDAARRFGRLRPLMEQYGLVTSSKEHVARSDVPSWGYNQIDEKGAFVDDWPVSYSGWGEAYGRGLGLTEDQRVFADMIAAAERLPAAKKMDLITAIEKQVRGKLWKNPLILQSLDFGWEYEELRRKELFIPRYHQECPQTAISGIDGFAGVLKIDGTPVPVFDVFVQDEYVAGKVVIADLTKFARFEQYVPIDDPGDDEYVLEDRIFVRVRDLNRDDGLRAKILGDNPEWLRDKPDKERFLRMHVVVNAYEKLKVEILNRAHAVVFDVEDEADGS